MNEKVIVAGRGVYPDHSQKTSSRAKNSLDWFYGRVLLRKI